MQVDLIGAKPHNRTSYWLARAMGMEQGCLGNLSDMSQMKMQTGGGGARSIIDRKKL